MSNYYFRRGKARGGGTPYTVGAASETFVKAGGTEYIDVYIDGFFTGPSDTKLIQNQAYYFLLSAHGSHHTGNLAIWNTTLTPETITNANAWDHMYMVMISGCSVLDILKKPYPGKRWAKTGPLFLVGYRSKAPKNTSTQHGHDIINWWCEYFLRYGVDIVNSWYLANDKYIKNGYNACVIQTDITPHRFRYFKRKFHNPREWQWTYKDSDGSW